MKHFTKNLQWMLLCLLFGISNSSWAAGYTRTLNENLEVAGYKFKALYDFQNNSPEVLPTSGDLRYRPYEKGGYWGLHNFGGGGRSGTAAIPVSEGDILIIQNYSGYTSTINCGSENAALTASTGYQVFDITTTSTSITFSVPRSGGIVAALVMEKDASAAKADYTINYIYNSTTIKTVTGNEAVGTTIVAENPITIEGQKYFAVANATTSMTLSSNGTNVLNVNLRLPNTYTYTVSSSLGTTIASGNATEGESVTIPYPQYELKDGTLYEAQKYNDSKKEYRHTYNFTENTEATIEYNETNITNVVYFSEAENIVGATATSAANNMPIRSSNGACGYATEDISLVNLPAGAYKAVMVCFSNSSGGAITHFQFGEESYDAVISGANNWAGFEKEFTLVSQADVKWLTSGDSKNGLDYIYIVKTGDVEFVDVAVTTDGELDGKFYATYSNAEKALDFSAVEGLTAYYVTSATTSNITIEEVEKVPAGAAVLIAGAEATTYQVPVIPNFESTETNLLQVSNGEKTGDGQTIYVLGKGKSGVGFYLKKKDSAIAAGKAYLEIEDEGTSGVKSFLSLGGDDAVAISNVEAAQGIGILYNLNGQRVAAPVKGGLYIMNGKKMLVK